MAIDRSGEWWIGTKPTDLETYLRAYSRQEAYPATRFAHARCECGGRVFRAEADPDEGAVRRICAKCRRKHFVCDSGEFWEDAEPGKLTCIECKIAAFDLCVGFAMRSGGRDVKWVLVGYRCTGCGILGCCADWKIDYSPSLQLLKQA